MGLEIDRDRFDDDEYVRFAARLQASLAALRAVLARPGFGLGPRSLGAELELFLVDRAGRSLPLNRAVRAATFDSRVTVEVDRFNLECNTRPVPLAGRPFSALQRELEETIAAIGRAAAPFGGRVAMIGILPTLEEADLQSSSLTDLRRFRALSAGIRRLRDRPFHVAIEGDDPLELWCDDVTLEGANTSLQVHLRVEPSEFARSYNAAQIATAPVLAAAGNSPVFLGRRLWEETRIALFRQAVDDRGEPGADWRPARVSFGHGWVRAGVFELLAETVAHHPPLLPVVAEEDPLACVASGGVPALQELRLHHGTVWRWNRAVYDPTGGGHVRIELRALPAGPSMLDMLANAAFLVGLTLRLARDADELVIAMTFGQARRNFYAAARFGLDAELLWPSAAAPSPRPVRAADLVRRVLPLAREGLVDAGVDGAEVDRLLDVVAARVASRTTGARWQRHVLASLKTGVDGREALRAMLERYLVCASTGEPVHRWPVAG